MNLEFSMCAEITLSKCLPHNLGANDYPLLTHWDQVTHICIANPAIIVPDNGLSPGWCQAVVTIATILLIGPLGTNFSKISIKIHIFSFRKVNLKNGFRFVMYLHWWFSRFVWLLAAIRSHVFPIVLWRFIMCVPGGWLKSFWIMLSHPQKFISVYWWLSIRLQCFQYIMLMQRHLLVLGHLQIQFIDPWTFTDQRWVGPVKAPNFHSLLIMPFLTNLSLEKMAVVSQTILPDAFSWMKCFVFCLNFHWTLFLRAQLSITQHWFR